MSRLFRIGRGPLPYDLPSLGLPQGAAMSCAGPRALVLDGMWNKALAAVRSLGGRGLRVTAGERSRAATALFSRYCSKRLIYASPAGNPEGFLEDLERELEGGGYDAVFPMEWTTQLLLTGAGNRARLEKYTRIPFADAGLAKTVNDKAQLLKRARELGVDIPETHVICDMGELDRVAGAIPYPAVIKPRISSGSRGLVYVGDRGELMRQYPLAHERYPFPLVQEYIPGEGGVYGVGVLLNMSSRARASFVYRRIRSYPVSGGPSTLRESVRRRDLQDTAEYLLSSLGWTGVAHVEFKTDQRDGRPKLMEVNPRFWGSLALAVEAGVDFPYLLYKLAVDGDVAEVKDYKTGVRLRWLIPGDLLHYIYNPRRFSMKPGFFDFRDKDDIISLHDPLPTLGRILSAFTLISDREMRGLIRR
jgi:predicted ATP-grasp superfamily ATP-dependent carboligase